MSGPKSRLKLPWERDPSDREGSYRKPVPVEERLRLTVKGASVVGAFLWIRAMTQDGADVGAEFLIGIGAPLLIAGLLDLVWTLRGRLEHVFIESRGLQIAAHVAVASLGVAMTVAGAVARAG